MDNSIPTDLKEILETWLDEAMGASLLSVGIDGYKGETDPERIDELRKVDYDQALDEAKKALLTYIDKEIIKARLDEVTRFESSYPPLKMYQSSRVKELRK